jgi:hypothetical protein
MRIAYFNNDEVNQALAARIAAKLGMTICNSSHDGARSDSEIDAVIYNADEMPEDLRCVLLKGLGRGSQDFFIAVHGYGLSDEELEFLRRKGIAASRRLDADFFRTLRRAVRRRQRAVLTNDGPADLTWVNLVK